MLGRSTACNGEKPVSTSSGAVITTGTPNPPAPCRNEANAHARASARRFFDGMAATKPRPMA